ncbi:hypothetical protein F5Y06DRAFT_281987 [Hypoxylon sp. FL0890]|nr:hypothetical protein F5Y06DRAFT_281987 [Hypoxylon sp. FL0890]
MSSFSSLLLHLLFITLAVFTEGQRTFIDQVSAYASLPSCAEVPLSFIVRDMASGCGDGGKTTSYSCFCTASSSKMNGFISSAVASRCSTGPVTAASQAVDVFASYCGLGNSGHRASGNGTSPVTANANATVTQTVTSTPTRSMPVETALSPIPSNLATGPSDSKQVFICVIIAIMLSLGLSW